MNKRFVLSCTVFFFLFSGVFAAQLEIFPAFPIALSDAYGQTPSSLSGGLGIGLTSMDKSESFGITMRGIVSHRLLDMNNGVDSVPLPEGMSPIGIDVALGTSVLVINTRYFAMPVTIAFHTRAAILEGATQFDFGIAGITGFTFWGKQQSGFFVRSVFYLDFTRVQFIYENFTFEKNLGFEPKARLSSFGIIPEIGFTIHLGKKTPVAKP
jgi:hypothetical protein